MIIIIWYLQYFISILTSTDTHIAHIDLTCCLKKEILYILLHWDLRNVNFVPLYV